jgi:hypothetical protein
MKKFSLLDIDFRDGIEYSVAFLLASAPCRYCTDMHVELLPLLIPDRQKMSHFPLNRPLGRSVCENG